MAEPLERLKTALADRYTIEREIGRGGMATVYLAEDLKHERQVALKVFSPELAEALGPERFLQEIRIAANLRHPHILPLYDSGEAAGFLYYVMPFVEGESLRDRLIREKQLAIDDALQIAREVADALSYAHSHGVIHRDVKPENILLESGHAVVADFGIARAIDLAGGERLTQTGIAVGTPPYMSPEQAGGEKDIDGRSDLYALGCVLHEMLAGQPPFTGPTVESLVVQHLSAEPPSVTSIRPSVPGWVAAALERSLSKTPADRFNPVAQFGEAIAPRVSVTDSSVPVAVSRKQRVLVPMLFAAAILVVVAVVLFRTLRSGPLTITVSNVTQVTNEPGPEMQPALSPDGSEVAFVVAGEIVVQSTIDIGMGGESRPGEDSGEIHRFPTWMPDGSTLRYCAWSTDEGCSWKQVGKLGGSVRTISTPRSSDRYAWSRDGTRVAFAAGDSIFAFAAADGEPRLLGVHRENAHQPHSLVWSPDGQWIAFVNNNPSWRVGANIGTSSIWMIAASGGDPVPVTDQSGLNVSPQWLPDSRHLLFVSDRDGSRGIHLVETGPNGAEGPVRSVLASADAHTISISADGRRLAYARFTVSQNIWSFSRSGSGMLENGVPVTRGTQTIEDHDLSPDGEWIAFDSDRRGKPEIWKMRLPDGNPQLVAEIDGTAFRPEWSPDGTEVVFYGGRGRSYTEVYVVSAGGGAPVQITDAPGWDSYPTWSPDGLSIAYGSEGPQGESPSDTWSISREAVGMPWGDPVQLTDFNCRQPDLAPDGGSLVCRTDSDLVQIAPSGEILARIPVGAGLEPLEPHYSSDGSEIFFLTHDGGRWTLWSVPTLGGDPTRVLIDDPTPRTVLAKFFSGGGERMFLTLAEYESDIYVVDLTW